MIQNFLIDVWQTKEETYCESATNALQTSTSNNVKGRNAKEKGENEKQTAFRKLFEEEKK